MFVLTDSDVSAQMTRNQELVRKGERNARLSRDAAETIKPRQDWTMILGTVISRLSSIFRQPATTLPAGS